MKSFAALAVALSLALFATAQHAYAFNPQPDPPGKIKIDKMQKASPGAKNMTNSKIKAESAPGNSNKALNAIK